MWFEGVLEIDRPVLMGLEQWICTALPSPILYTGHCRTDKTF